MDEKTQLSELAEAGVQGAIGNYQHTFQDGSTRNIRYTHVGDTTKLLAVLVHGAPGSSSANLAYLKDSSLLEKFQLLAIDRPGYGYSDCGEVELSLERQVAPLSSIIQQFTNERVVLMGHSFGGPFITRFAMDYEAQVGGLVLVAGSVSPELEPEEWWRPVVDFFAIRWVLPASLTVCNQEIMALKGELEKMLPLWQTIRCPVTIIQGEDDNLVPKGNADFAQQMLINSELVKKDIIPKANHFILWSEHDRIVKAMLAL